MVKRLAAEIEKSTTGNIHLQEDADKNRRGDGNDEEALGAVLGTGGKKQQADQDRAMVVWCNTHGPFRCTTTGTITAETVIFCYTRAKMPHGVATAGEVVLLHHHRGWGGASKIRPNPETVKKQ